MTTSQIVITSRLNEQQKLEAAKILYDYFIHKFSQIWLYTKDEKQTYNYIRKGLNYNYGIYAVLEGKVIGLLGLDSGRGKCFMDFSFSTLAKTFNWFGGFWRFFKYYFKKLLIHTNTTASQTRIDPIAVSTEALGKGIESLLLKTFEKYSKRIGNKAIVLEVVDSDPLAKKLYEKEGYVAYKYLCTSFFTKKAGFDGIYFMKKNLA